MMQGVGWGLGGFGGGGAHRQRFEEQYHVYSVAFADKSHLEKGDKILLPPSAFDTLARLQVDYPMLFQLKSDNKTTHCGVLEFTAEEGCCYIPAWMMQNLLVSEGALLTVTNVSLPKATFVKLQPQSTDFLEISNPRAVLEHALRNYSCVTVHDIIQIPYNSKNYQFELKDVKPAPAACIIETDCNVDFDAPVGYVEPEKQHQQQPQPPASTISSTRSSACPSPATTASGSFNTATAATGGAADEETATSTGIRIVVGKIIRPETSSTSSTSQITELLAEKTGSTGVQQNAAVLQPAPEIDYWAVAAGDGARLDGKKPAVLQDASGNVVDVRQLRAEAAAKRQQQQQAAAGSSNLEAKNGMTVSGQQVEAAANAAAGAETADAGTSSSTVVSKRKKRVGSKFSRLKSSSSAFQGSANQFHNNK